MDGIPKNTFLQNTSGWVLLEYILLATTLSYEIENWINNCFGRTRTYTNMKGLPLWALEFLNAARDRKTWQGGSWPHILWRSPILPTPYPLYQILSEPLPLFVAISLTGQVITLHPLCHFLLNEIMDLLGVSLLRSNA